MQTYLQAAAARLGEAASSLRALDIISAEQPAHRLDALEPLAERLDAIRDDLAAGRLVPATRKTNELAARLAGGMWAPSDPRFRAAAAAALGSYQRAGVPAKAMLGGLRGGRPRKDGKPTRTLESKGYGPDSIPPKKLSGMRVHPARTPAV